MHGLTILELKETSHGFSNRKALEYLRNNLKKRGKKNEREREREVIMNKEGAKF